MGKRIFSFTTIMLLLFSFYTVSLSSEGIKRIEAIEDKLLFKADKKDFKISCLNVNGKLYLPMADFLKLIGGEVEYKEDYFKLRNYRDFPEADCLNGEIFVYASIQKIDHKKKEIIIEQHMDDNSIKVSPLLKVREDAILIVERKQNRMNISFQDLKIGDVAGLILDKEGMVRGIIVSI